MLQVPDSLMSQLERHEPPAHWVLPLDRGAVVLSNALDVQHIAGVEDVALDATDTIVVHRFDQDSGVPDSGVLRLQLVHTGEVRRLAEIGDMALTATDADSDGTGVVELFVGPASTEVCAGRRRLSSVDRGHTHGPITLHHRARAFWCAATDTPTQASLTLLTTALARLDTDPGTRGWASIPGRTRRTDVFALPVSGVAAGTRGRIELMGWLSEGWADRLASGRWHHYTADGNRVDPAVLDAYGRAGGLILHGRLPGDAPHADPVTANTIDPGSSLFDGDRRQWMARVRNVDTLLYNIAAEAYLQHQGGSSPTIAAQDAMTGGLGASLLPMWHRGLAHHVDVVSVLARGMGRFRYSDPAFPDRSRSILVELGSTLAESGVSAAPVVMP